jgi:multidrug efflux pump subunit AcrA (membrane-fusion protein)
MDNLMNIKAAALLFVSLPFAAAAEPVTVTGCAKLPYVEGIYACDMRNDTQTPIAAINYTAGITQEGRTVPWVSPGKPRAVDVPGGIEPGETVSVNVFAGYSPEDVVGINVAIHVLSAEDVNGAKITAP